MSHFDSDEDAMTLHSRHGRNPWHDPLLREAKHMNNENAKLRAENERLRAFEQLVRRAVQDGWFDYEGARAALAPVPPQDSGNR